VAEESKSDLVTRVLAGDARAAARLMRLIDDRVPGYVDKLKALYPHTGRAYLVGVTGAPGAGKSTLVDRLTAEIRKDDRTVGVIAVDPTSPFTGGAILGDRVRMGGHAHDEGVFIRSMATRGHLGGLARATADVALVLDAAGKDIVIVETVGVGQDEVDIVRTADISIVVLMPGTGDDVQAIKAGIMEIADIYVVNKADREGAEHLVKSIAASLSLHTFAPGDWKPPIVKTEATTGAGVPELWQAIRTFREQTQDRRAQRQRARQEARVRDLVSHAFMTHLERTLAAGEFEQVIAAVADRRLDPYSAARDLLRRAIGSTSAS
jgi:LAO/AO transport system kinase